MMIPQRTRPTPDCPVWCVFHDSTPAASDVHIGVEGPMVLVEATSATTDGHAMMVVVGYDEELARDLAREVGDALHKWSRQ